MHTPRQPSKNLRVVQTSSGFPDTFVAYHIQKCSQCFDILRNHSTHHCALPLHSGHCYFPLKKFRRQFHTNCTKLIILQPIKKLFHCFGFFIGAARVAFCFCCKCEKFLEKASAEWYISLKCTILPMAKLYINRQNCTYKKLNH